MSYVDSHLLNGEKIEHVTRLHWKHYFLPGTICFFILLASGGMFSSDNSGVGVLALLIAVSVLLWPYIVLKSSEFAVTNKRVIVKVGVIRTKSLEIFLSKIEGITVDQSLMGRMLNYGDIVVAGSGGTKESFFGIQAPLDFRKAVHQATDSISA